MKSIIFCSQVDLFIDNGGAYANRAQLDSFIELGYAITLIIPFTGAVIPEYYKNKVEIVYVPKRSGLEKLAGLFMGRIHRFSPFVEKWYKDNGKKKNRKYAFVYISGGIVAGDLAPFFQKEGLKVVTFHANVEYHYYLDNKDIATMWGMLPFWVRKKEQNALMHSYLNLTITDEDRLSLIQIYSLPISVNIVCWGCYEYRDKGKVEIADKANNGIFSILIMGTLKDPQTYLSILSIKSVLKYYIANNAMTQIIIAGRRPPKSLYDEFGNTKGFKIIDTPEDMGKIIASADLLLNPVKMGSGLKLRNMDALRYGLPCLVHTVSACGYEKMQQYGFFNVYSTNDELYRLIDEMKLCKDGYSRYDIATIYNSFFSFSAGVENLKCILANFAL